LSLDEIDKQKKQQAISQVDPLYGKLTGLDSVITNKKDDEISEKGKEEDEEESEEEEEDSDGEEEGEHK
jgi:hypothetical protein